MRSKRSRERAEWGAGEPARPLSECASGGLPTLERSRATVVGVGPAGVSLRPREVASSRPSMLSCVISPQRLRRLRRPAFLGTLRRTKPLSDWWGFDRGTPVDRYYIERFLAEHRDAVRGRVLEVKDSRYTDRFGSSVRERAVLDINSANPRATVIADLATADAVPTDSFDCFILTQTLQYVYDLPAALRHAHRILSPGGVLLVTAPALSRIDPACPDKEYWRFTAASLRSLLAEVFPPDRVAVRTYGNVLAGIAFLTGMAAEELRARELAEDDPYFPLVVAARAEKG